MYRIQYFLIAVLCTLLYNGAFAQVQHLPRVYNLWDDRPAPNRGNDGNIISRGFPYDADWEAHSYPLGNGYMGANVFGRTDTERIQITDKTLTNGAPYDFGGMTNFAEVFIEFDHYQVQNYQRSLNLNRAICSVEYDHQGVHYTREYLVNYPQNVMAVRLTADGAKNISFTLHAKNPHLRNENERCHSGSVVSNYARTGKTKVDSNLLVLSGSVPAYNINYETQLRVIHEGGMVFTNNENGRSEIRVVNADVVTLLIAVGTNYLLSPEVFLNDDKTAKNDPKLYPHASISNRLDYAEKMGFEELKNEHLTDYGSLFSRVQLELTNKKFNRPTRELVEIYEQHGDEVYLEELMFHYGRYLLISSSRPESLPATLQGVWSQYHVSPWSGGYWHNINVQMNYWGAFSTNLLETFGAYEKYFEAYREKAYRNGDAYIKQWHPHNFSEGANDNGWCIGTGGSAYAIESPGGHSGPGTGGFTAKLFLDRFEFSRDTAFLREVAYPAIYGMSQFLHKTLNRMEDGTLLVERSASPEQRHDGNYYMTMGTTFDQGFVWETFHDAIRCAQILKKEDAFIRQIRLDIERLDPIHIGDSGQIKEYREETYYGEIGDPKHRHISHLCALYPGTLISSNRQKWMEAAIKTLELRGNNTTGWAMAHRMNLRARTHDGDAAHEVYSKFLRERTLPNLWTIHPPFQIDGNLGTMAGVSEMLLQSHEGYIDPLAALPKAWESGRFDGLLTRGNFEISLRWKLGKINNFRLTSNVGGACRLRIKNARKIVVLDQNNKMIPVSMSEDSIFEFPTIPSTLYTIKW